MTKKALKLLLSMQVKVVCWFIGIYALVIVVLLILPSYIRADTKPSMLVFTVYAPKIYLLAMGVIYPLIATKLYVSQGLTRKQFFLAYTGAISIISLFLLIPILAVVIYFDNISLSFAIIHYLQMPLYFLLGWTCAVGFQLRKWYTAIIGILGAIVIYQSMLIATNILHFSSVALLGYALFLLAALLLILPRIISQIPLKG